MGPLYYSNIFNKTARNYTTTIILTEAGNENSSSERSRLTFSEAVPIPTSINQISKRKKKKPWISPPNPSRGLSSPFTDRHCWISTLAGAARQICTIVHVLLLQEDTRSPNPAAACQSALHRCRRAYSSDPSSSWPDLGSPSLDPARPHWIWRSCCRQEKKRVEVLLPPREGEGLSSACRARHRKSAGAVAGRARGHRRESAGRCRRACGGHHRASVGCCRRSHVGPPPDKCGRRRQTSAGAAIRESRGEKREVPDGKVERDAREREREREREDGKLPSPNSYIYGNLVTGFLDFFGPRYYWKRLLYITRL